MVLKLHVRTTAKSEYNLLSRGRKSSLHAAWINQPAYYETLKQIGQLSANIKRLVPGKQRREL